MTLSPELSKKMYKDMWRIRLFEEEAHRQTSLGSVVGALHMYCGEEAVAVGVCGNLRDDDYVLGTHRSHGHCLAKGAQSHRMMAELFGKSTGTCAGKGGSMHIADFSLNMLGANGIVGAGIGPAPHSLARCAEPIKCRCASSATALPRAEPFTRASGLDRYGNFLLSTSVRTTSTNSGYRV